MLDFLKHAFADMKASAKAQHEVDKAQLEAVRAESRATFEENRGRNTFARAKAESKQERDAKLAEAKVRTAAANDRYEAARR